MNRHKGRYNRQAKQSLYGYAKFQSIFMKHQTLKCRIFIELMHNLKEMQIYNLNNAKSGFKPSISLDDDFLTEMVECIKYISETVGCIFNKWIIFEPKDSIKEFIINYQSVFNEYKWKLKKGEYQNKDGQGSGAKSDNVLFIYRESV